MRRFALAILTVAVAATRIVSSSSAQNRPALPTACAEIPNAPTELTATVEVARLSLTWRAPDRGCAPETYEIDAWCDCFANGVSENPTRTPATTFTIDGLPSDAFRVRVRAVNAAGKSQPSDEVRFTVARWGEHSTPDVIVAARTADRRTFFPTVERLANGHLIAVYYDSPEHISQLGRISMAISTDGGRHWSPPRVAIDTPNDDRDPSVMQTRDGTLLLSFFSVDRTQSNVPLGVYVSRSRDEGATWSAPVRAFTKLSGPATSAKIVQLENGDLLLPIYGRAVFESTETRAAVLRSTDGGETWPGGEEVELASPPGTDFSEPAIADLGGGKLIAVIRAERGDTSAYWTRSDDNGRTWTPPVRLDLDAQAPDLLTVRMAGDSRTRVIFSYGELSQKFGEGRRTGIEARDADGFGRVAGPRVVYHGHCSWGDESYPSTVRISETQLFTVYYDACAGIIGGTFSNLSDFLQPR